jgi:hypothetical protein
VRLFKVLFVVALVVLAASIVRADSTPPASLTPIALGPDGTIDPNALATYDSTLIPGDSGLGANGGPHGSPSLSSTETLVCPDDGTSCTINYAVSNGVVTGATMTLNGGNVGQAFCQPSDAFLVQSFFPVVTDGTFTCIYTTDPGPVSEPGETLGQMEIDCLATNLAALGAQLSHTSPIYSDPDDCVGVAAGSDIFYSLDDVVAGSSTTANVTGIPEPEVPYLLLVGLAGLIIFRRTLAY